MPLAGLLSAYSRAVLQTLLAVFFGTYLPKRIFRAKSLPGVPHPKYPQLPSYPGQDEEETEVNSAHKPTPILLIEAPPPPHIAGCFPTNISRNDPFTLWLSSYFIDALNDGKTPIQEVDSVVHSAAVLGAYLFILAAATFYASYRRPARRGPGLYIAELYEYLTGFPYAPPSQWDRVLHNPSPDMNTAECWDAYGMGFYDVNLFSDAEALISESTSSGTATPNDAQRYAAWINPDKLDEFTNWMMQLGFTDIRTSMEDISPPDEHPDAMLVDFRFSARSPSKEILSKIIMHVVKPSDVPKDRTDFIFWDLGEGWFRAFEEHIVEENLAFMAILPFFELANQQKCDSDEAASDSEDEMVPIVKLSSPRPIPLVLGTATTSPSASSASTTLPDLDAFDDLDSPTGQSPNWLATAFSKTDRSLSTPGSPVDESADGSVVSASFVVVSDGKKALDVTQASTELEPQSGDGVKAHVAAAGEAVTRAPSPVALESQANADDEAGLAGLDEDEQDEQVLDLDDTLVKAETPQTKSSSMPTYGPTEALEVDLTDNLHEDDDGALVLTPSAMEESWTEHLSESMYGQIPEIDLGAMNDGDFVDVTAELGPQPEVPSLPEAAASAPVEVQESAVTELPSPAPSGSPASQPVIDIFRVIEETHATADAVPEATACTESQAAQDGDAADSQTGHEDTAPPVEDVDSILDVFNEDLSFDDTDAAEPLTTVQDASAAEDTVQDTLPDAAEGTVAALPTEVSPEVMASHAIDSPTEEAAPGPVDILVHDGVYQVALGSEHDGSPPVTPGSAEPQEEKQHQEVHEESLVIEDAQPAVAAEAASIEIEDNTETEDVTETEDQLVADLTAVDGSEDALAAEDTPVANVTAIEDTSVEDSVVEDTPTLEDALAVEETSVMQETLPTEDNPTIEDAPTVEDAPVVEDMPAIEDATAVDDTPAVGDTSSVEDMPTDKEVPTAEATPTVEDAEPEAAVEGYPSAVDSEVITPKTEVANAELEDIGDNAVDSEPEATFAEQEHTVEDPYVLPSANDVVQEAQPAVSDETTEEPVGLSGLVAVSGVVVESPEQIVKVTISEPELCPGDTENHEEGVAQLTAESDEPTLVVGGVRVDDTQPQETAPEPLEADELAKDEAVEIAEVDTMPVVEQVQDVEETSVNVTDMSSPALGEIEPADIPLPDELDDDLSNTADVTPTPTNPADVPLPDDDDNDFASTPVPASPVVEDSELMDFDHIEVPTETENDVASPAESANVEEDDATDAAIISDAQPEAELEHAANAPEVAMLSMEASIGTLLDAAANSIWSLPSPSENAPGEAKDSDELHDS